MTYVEKCRSVTDEGTNRDGTVCTLPNCKAVKYRKGRIYHSPIQARFQHYVTFPERTFFPPAKTKIPKRSIEDVFMNVHNPPMITKLLMCNNNVQIGMKGRSIFYSAGYEVKSHQKEERLAFEKVSAMLCKVIQKQVSREQYIIQYNI
jgi:hypothetical protein